MMMGGELLAVGTTTSLQDNPACPASFSSTSIVTRTRCFEQLARGIAIPPAAKLSILARTLTECL